MKVLGLLLPGALKSCVMLIEPMDACWAMSVSLECKMVRARLVRLILEKSKTEESLG